MLTIEADRLAGWVAQQRWFASKSRELAHVNLLEVQNLREEPQVVLALLEARFAEGTHELYQLILTGKEERAGADAIAQANGWALYETLAEPEQVRVFSDLWATGASVEGERGTTSFHWIGPEGLLREECTVRPMGAEQSNSSVVIDEKLVMKAFRRLEPGDNPELEMLRFLTSHGFENVAALHGWYEYSGELMDATLGVVQEFLPEARDGWELVLDAVGSGDEAAFGLLRELGAVVGRMHSVLGSDPSDPDFAPEEPSVEGLALLTATIDEEIERTWVDLPSGVEALAPIAGRGDEIRDLLKLMGQVPSAGRTIRHHGDLHLGQTLRSEDRWILLDFEGEPARSLRERRRKRSPLRDVAGMLRSIAYAASASELQRGTPAPAGWEGRARQEFLDGYLESVDPVLLPPSAGATQKVLTIYELEKAVYELRYELNNRPDWLGIPVAGIQRMLEQEVTSL